MKVIVTGGGGFVGSNLVKKLISNLSIDEIYVVDAKVEGFNEDNLVKNNNKVNNHFVSFNLDWKDIIDTIKPNFIFNLASLSHVDSSIKNPSSFILYNECKFIEMLEAIVGKDIFILHMSTDEVFGSVYKGSVNEDSELINTGNSKTVKSFTPSSIYSLSKLNQEKFLQLYSSMYDIQYAILRSTNIYGEGQCLSKFIPKIIDCLLKNKEIPLYGDGSNFRTWIHVSDVVSLLETMFNFEISNSLLNVVYHVSNNMCELSNIELILTIAEIMKVNPKVLFIEDRLLHDYRYSLDYNITSNEFGWKPMVNIMDGLYDLVNHFKAKSLCI